MYMPFFNTGFGFSGGFCSPCCCCNPFGINPFAFNPFYTNMIISNPFTTTNLCSVPYFNSCNFQPSYNYQMPDISAFMPKFDFSQYTDIPSHTTLSDSNLYSSIISNISKNVLNMQTTANASINSINKQVNLNTVQEQKSSSSSKTSSAQKNVSPTQGNTDTNKQATQTVSVNKAWYEMTDSELKNIYGNYTRDITKKYTGGIDKLNRYLKGKGVLENYGQSFMNAQEKYGISASVLIGICMNESAQGTSNLAKNNNNVGGIRIPGSNEFKKFASVDECIMEMAGFLKTGYVNNSTRSLTKLYEVNSRYCPITDTTDTKHVNSGWASAVDRFATEAESA